jgi:hypothetical protein
VPEPTRWHWAYDAAAGNMVAVELSGQQKVVAPFDLLGFDKRVAFPLDETRALLFVKSGENMRAFLLSLDAVQEISLPDSFPYDANLSFRSLTLVAVRGQKAFVAFTTRQSHGGGITFPSRGPGFLIDLDGLSARMVDANVYNESLEDPRSWFFPSDDGRYVRFFAGDDNNLQIRELDMDTGQDRVLENTVSTPKYIVISREGEVWYMANVGQVGDINGNHVDYPEPDSHLFPLAKGNGIITPKDCSAPCTLELIEPFGGNTHLTYAMPWNIEQTSFYPMLTQLLPDQTLLTVGTATGNLFEFPVDFESYPGLLDDDLPVFRLSPEGESEWVGIYSDLAFFSEPDLMISADWRYMLMKSTDQSNYYIYDTLADKALFNLPVEEGWDMFYATAQFFEHGAFIHLTGSNGNNEFKEFFSRGIFDTSETVVWTEQGNTFSSCTDLYSDGMLACWYYDEAQQNSDFVRVDPASGTRMPLLENVIEFEAVW